MPATQLRRCPKPGQGVGGRRHCISWQPKGFTVTPFTLFKAGIGRCVTLVVQHSISCPPPPRPGAPPPCGGCHQGMKACWLDGLWSVIKSSHVEATIARSTDLKVVNPGLNCQMRANVSQGYYLETMKHSAVSRVTASTLALTKAQ
jgi:hypothetical protein